MKHHVGMKISIWLITILWMAVIFYFSSQPAELSKEESGKVLIKMNLLTEGDIHVEGDRRIFLLQYYIRKTAHLAVFLILGILMALSFSYTNFNPNKSRIFAFLSGTIYAVSDEIHQMFIPGRGPQFSDVLLDSLGILLGVVFIAIGTALSNRVRVKY